MIKYTAASIHIEEKEGLKGGLGDWERQLHDQLHDHSQIRLGEGDTL